MEQTREQAEKEYWDSYEGDRDIVLSHVKEEREQRTIVELQQYRKNYDAFAKKIMKRIMDAMFPETVDGKDKP